MSIELRQKLEDVKQEIKEQEQILANKEIEIIDNNIRKIKQDFKEFFEEKFFNVVEQKNQIEATYYDLKVRLVFEDPESDGYMGLNYAIDLETNGFDLNKRTIDLDRKVLPSPIEGTQFYTAKKTINDEISEAQKVLTNLKNRISTLPNEEWCLFLQPDQYVPGQKPTLYETITELISALID